MSALSYPELASEFLRGASLFVRKYEVVSKDCALGSKVVKITIPVNLVGESLEILDGLIESNSVSYPDYDLVFFFGRFDDFSPDLSIFKEADRPLGQVRSNLSYPTRIAHDLHSNSVVVYDPDSATAVIWVEDPSQYPYWAKATPFRLALSWIADTFDGEFLHGALLGLGGKGLVLAGKSGAGKSTTSLAAQTRGFELISDDFFLFEGDRMYPVYTRAKIHDSSVEMFDQELRSKILNPNQEGEKRIVSLDLNRLLQFRGGIKVKNFVIPRRADVSSYKRISVGKVLLQLAPYSLAGLLGGTSRSMLRMKRALASSNGWELALSPALDENSDALLEIMAES